MKNKIIVVITAVLFISIMLVTGCTQQSNQQATVINPLYVVMGTGYEGNDYVKRNLINQRRKTMVSTNLGSRHDIKTSLKNVYDAVEAEDHSQALIALDTLRYSIRTYYTTRGKPVERFVDLWEDTKYLLLKATNNQYKKEILEESIDKITMALRDDIPGDPNAHLKELYEEIQHSYGLIGEDKLV